MRKLILHIPHSSTNIPFYDGFVNDMDKIDREIVKLTDWFTDDLFSNEIDDAIITPFSRIFCDVERFADDKIEIMSKFGMGVLYEKFDDEKTLREVTPELRKRILKDFYWKHHESLSELVKTRLEFNDNCLIVDCHSFPEKALNRSLNKTTFRPDFNIGTDEFHTPKKLIELSKRYFEELGYSLGIDEPYSGTMVPMEYYKKDDRVQSIMLEVNRKLYLDVDKKSEGYEKTKAVVQGYLNLLKKTTKLYTLEEALKSKPKNLEWISSYRKDHRFKDVRFKFYIEDDMSINFEFISEWIDLVSDLEEFNRFEINRIPLIVGDQFELLPSVITEIKELKTPIIAVLRQQLWDSKIKGLSICSVNLKKKPITSYLSRKELVKFK